MADWIFWGSFVSWLVAGQFLLFRIQKRLELTHPNTLGYLGPLLPAAFNPFTYLRGQWRWTTFILLSRYRLLQDSQLNRLCLIAQYLLLAGYLLPFLVIVVALILWWHVV